MPTGLLNEQVLACLRERGVDLSPATIKLYTNLIARSWPSSGESTKLRKSDPRLEITHSVLIVWDPDNKCHIPYLVLERLDPLKQKVATTRAKGLLNLFDGTRRAAKITCVPHSPANALVSLRTKQVLLKNAQQEYQNLKELGDFVLPPFSMRSTSQGKEGPTHYLVTDELGKDLRTWLSLEEERARQYSIGDHAKGFAQIKDIVTGMMTELQRVHRSGSIPNKPGTGKVYGDVKLSNFCQGKAELTTNHQDDSDGWIVISVQSGPVKIIDLADAGPESETLISGTFEYMAPELLSKQATRSQGSDIYSLGVAIIFLLLNSPSVTAIAREKPNFKHTQLRRLFTLGAQLMHPNPAKRPNIEGALRYVRKKINSTATPESSEKTKSLLSDKKRVDFLLHCFLQHSHALYKTEQSWQKEFFTHLIAPRIHNLLHFITNHAGFFEPTKENSMQTYFFCWALTNNPKHSPAQDEQFFAAAFESSAYFSALKKQLSKNSFALLTSLVSYHFPNAGRVLDIVKYQSMRIEQFLQSENVNHTIQQCILLLQKLEKTEYSHQFAWYEQMINQEPKKMCSILYRSFIIFSQSKSPAISQAMFSKYMQALSAYPQDMLPYIATLIDRYHDRPNNKRCLFSAGLFIASASPTLGTDSHLLKLYTYNLFLLFRELSKKEALQIDSIKEAYEKYLKQYGLHSLLSWSKTLTEKQLLTLPIKTFKLIADLANKDPIIADFLSLAQAQTEKDYQKKSQVLIDVLIHLAPAEHLQLTTAFDNSCQPIIQKIISAWKKLSNDASKKIEDKDTRHKRKKPTGTDPLTPKTDTQAMENADSDVLPDITQQSNPQVSKRPKLTVASGHTAPSPSAFFTQQQDKKATPPPASTEHSCAK